MNGYAVFHQPESNYAYAKQGNGLVITLRIAADDKPERVEILYNNKYDFTKRRSATVMRRCADDGTFAYYRADFTLSDARFAYIFKITENGKVYYYSEDGLSEEYDFNLAYYNFFQFAFINAVDVLPVVDWTKDAVFYQIFVDRFARGDFEKDGGYINTPWDKPVDRHSFTGGDLEGIKNELPYLHRSGFTALYLTPIFLSRSNHKYNVTDYMQVDPQFGGNGKLKGLLDSAHKLGMKVIVDCVFNHCDKTHKFFADVEKRGRKSAYYGWFIIDGDFPDVEKGNYARFADCKYMPKWNTSNPEVRKYLTDIALEYLGTGFDGLRLDVADEISHEMWRQLRRAVKAKYPEALIIGEVWHNNAPWLQGDQFDGVMNYKLQKILVDYFGENPTDAKSASDRMNALLAAGCDQSNGMALNFLDNHDTPRFLRFAGGNKDKLLCALCAAFVFPGMPCVFYGTEIPLDGGGDPDCRRTFDRASVERSGNFGEKYDEIIRLKKQPALAGVRAEVTAEDGILKIVRYADGEKITAFFNTGGKEKKLEFSGEVLFSLNYKNGLISNDGAVVVKNI